MHGLRADALALAGAVADHPGARTGTLGVFPPFTVLGEVARRARGHRHRRRRPGLPSEPRVPSRARSPRRCSRTAGPTAVIVGHSERRHGLGETDALVRAKAAGGLAAACSSCCASARPRPRARPGETVEVLDAPAGRQLARRRHRATTSSWPTSRSGRSAPAGRATHGRHRREPRRDRQRLARAGAGSGERSPSSTAARSSRTMPREIMAVPGVAGVLVGGASLGCGRLLVRSIRQAAALDVRLARHASPAIASLRSFPRS